MLNGAVWQSRLAQFGGRFAKRRTEFEFALSIHSAAGIDAAKRTLDIVEENTKAIDEKVNMMMEMFQNLASPEERQLTKAVSKLGGSRAIHANGKLLRQLSNEELDGSLSTNAVGTKAGRKRYSLEDLREDLRADPEEIIKNNLVLFSRKFEIQQNRILEELNMAVKREGDRVIQTIVAGPHDRIFDPVSGLFHNLSTTGLFLCLIAGHTYALERDGNITAASVVYRRLL